MFLEFPEGLNISARESVARRDAHKKIGENDQRITEVTRFQPMVPLQP